MTLRSWMLLFTLSALWGGSFLFLRVASPVLGPVWLIELRVLIAGMLLLAVSRLRREAFPAAAWRVLLVIGVINSAIPFTLIAAAELRLPASTAATLNAATPFFGALAGAVWSGERITPARGLGLLAGFIGVAVAGGLGPSAIESGQAWSVAASLAGALSYGLAAVFTRKRAGELSSLAIATWSQLFAALALVPLLPFTVPARVPSAAAVGSVIGLGVLCTAVAYLIFFHLIRTAGATSALTVTYLAPVFGVFWGTLLLGERLTWNVVLGLAIILASVAVVNGISRGEASAASRAATDQVAR